jgi:hypothetical protein
LYSVIGEPFEFGAIQDTFTVVPVAEALTDPGIPGTLAELTVAKAALAELPRAFLALIKKL